MLAAVPMADPRPPVPPLTVLQPSGRVERSDAARNRERILRAAEELFATRGVANTSMDDIASCAKVGKGTLYRRFGDRGGLALALLNEREAEFQDRMLFGPPPLGPGAPPAERLLGFFSGLCDVLDAHLDLIVDFEAGSPGSRYRQGFYGVYHRHVSLLVGELAPEADAGALAHLLLAPFSGDLYLHLHQGAGVPRQRLLGAMEELIRGLEGAAR
jgi:AcrR family transcriptional regulator